MLRLKDVHAYYSENEALKGVSIEVRKGEIVALIGANGAGKSTTLMTISGILHPRRGSIEFMGKEIGQLPPHKIVKRGISQVPEGRRIFPNLTVIENLEIGAYQNRDKNQVSSDMERVFHYFPILKERRLQKGGTLSGGEQQMLAIGRALMARPGCLLLDEPSLGLAPILVNKILEIIREIRDEGMTILLVEQNARAALMLADRGYVMETGRIVMENKADILLKDPKVRAAYLGEG